MKLEEAVALLPTLDDEITIYARRPWGRDAESALVRETGVRYEDNDAIREAEAAGFEYFLEVHVAMEVLEVFGERPPTADERFRLILHYAEYDAYPEWVYKR